MRTIKDVRDNLRPRRAMNVLRLASNVADGETITIGTEVYEIDTAAAPGAVTAGNIRVDCNAGVSPAVASAAIVAAINANTKYGLTAGGVLMKENPRFCNRGGLPVWVGGAGAAGGGGKCRGGAGVFL